MRVGGLVLAVALLAACASANGEGQTYQDGMGPLTDAARVGDGWWFISCQGAMSACTWRASKVCPNGFDVAKTGSTQATQGAMGPYGGGFGTVTNFTMSVNCKSGA